MSFKIEDEDRGRGRGQPTYDDLPPGPGPVTDPVVPLLPVDHLDLHAGHWGAHLARRAVSPHHAGPGAGRLRQAVALQHGASCTALQMTCSLH